MMIQVKTFWTTHLEFYPIINHFYVYKIKSYFPFVTRNNLTYSYLWRVITVSSTANVITSPYNIFTVTLNNTSWLIWVLVPYWRDWCWVPISEPSNDVKLYEKLALLKFNASCFKNSVYTITLHYNDKIINCIIFIYDMI